MAGKISVIGPGTMGSGITQSFLQAGYSVVVVGRSEESIKKGAERIAASMDKAIKKGAMSEQDKQKLLSMLKLTTDYSEISGSDAIIEAVAEELGEKTGVLRQAEKFAGHAIIATNTSSIPIKKMASALSDPSRFLGMHFFNPVPVMKPVEIVVAESTSEDTTSKAMDLAKTCGKVPIQVKDYPGFVANSVLMPMLNEAALLLEKGVADREGIDTIVKLGLNHPMGPLELADFIGLDVCKDIMEAIYNETGDEKYKPAKLISEKVSQGKLGRKSKEGFYEYK